MALLDLSLVTQTLTRLLEYCFDNSKAWPTNIPKPGFSSLPPDKLTTDSVSLYMYHISENCHYKNLPSPGNDAPPVMFTSMGLDLFYLLTAHSTSNDVINPIREQLMMSIAMKTLHDYPVIDDDTVVYDNAGAPRKVFPIELQGSDNRFRIALQTIDPAQAVSYWTAGSSPLRLSAYYQISVVLLEPEVPQTRSGRVLTYGVQIFVGGAPRIDGCENTLTFSLPGQTTVHEVNLRPAQVTQAPEPLPDPLPSDHQIVLNGSGLNGNIIELLLKNKQWDGTKTPDAVWWRIVPGNNTLKAVVRERISSTGDVIFPGIYSAIVKVVKQTTLPGGNYGSIEHLSNECPFAISPRIDSVSLPDPNAMVYVQGFSFTHIIQNKEQIDLLVYVGNIKYRKASNGLQNGEYRIVDESNIELKLSAYHEPGKDYPLRVFANGAESPPRWISIP